VISLSFIKQIDVVWAHEGSSYVYRVLPGSQIVNPDSESISFVLREIDGQDKSFEVVIQKKNSASYIFKTDYYEEPEKEYPLKPFASPDELLFYFKGNEGIAYFHLSSTE
jgi:hypothetical protein